jgi:RNA polymerase sigma-70 factor, ECF subfamily
MAWNDADDQTLVEGIRAGEAGAAEAFDARFRARLIAIGRRWRLASDDAEDVVQDTLLAALTQLREGKFEARASLGGWVGRIFHNRLVDVRRRDGRLTRHVATLPPDTSLDTLALPDRESGALQDTRLQVREALLSLPKRDRLMLLLNVQGGVPVRDIAVMMRLGTKNAEAIVTGAKRRIREFLRGPT